MPIGRRISIETLEGKILAVDASIWLTQFLKAMRDPDTGKVRPAAHLIGFIRRLCKLRYQGIRPVFVFDGATPEIKQREVRARRRQREQFRSEGDSIQRMAKRLLVQQLKKQGSQVAALKKKKKIETKEGDNSNKESKDTTTAIGAYAPGFYDPEMENTEDSSSSAKPSKAQEEHVSNISNIAVDTEVVDLLEDGQADYLDKATSRVSARSDWDIVDIDVEQDGGKTQTEGQKSSQTDDIRDYASSDPNDFDSEYVASLPSTMRKDLVEGAQRNRRLQSRREFMKVAYDPEGLSKCQLRNFLKSTKLNQNIKKMAQQASKSDGSQETPASDRTKRIIFETDGKDHSAQKKENNEQVLRKLRKVRKLSVMSSSEDESDEWHDSMNDTIVGTLGVPVAARRPKITIHDDDSESDERYSDNENLANGHGFMPSEGVARMPSQPLSKHDGGAEQSDEERCIGGSIHNGNSSNEVSAKSAGRRRLLGRRKMERVVAIQNDGNSSGDERKIPAREPRENAIAQELNDEAIARALQQAEYSSDSDGVGGFLPNNSVQGVPSVARQPEPALSSEESEADDINWEDGDDGESENADDVTASATIETDAGEILPTVWNGSNEKKMSPFQSKTESKDAPSRNENHTTILFDDTAAFPSPSDPLSNIVEHAGEASKEEIIAWEDGGNDEDSPYRKTEEEEAPPGVSTSRSYRGPTSSDGLDDEIEIHDDEDGDAVATQDDSWGEYFRIVNSKSSKEMTAALEHAQATAANLTNWAGRAFRRAVAQHAAENGLHVPESAKPKTIQTSKPDQTSPSRVRGQKEKEEQDLVDIDLLNQESRVGTKPKVDIAEQQSSSAAWPETLGEAAVLDTLEAYQEKWTDERNQEDRDMDTVTDEMRTEAMALLQLFGVPYVEAPAEAEAQCVTLETLGLVDGIVTEDSDAFVFGGRRVYKNIFDDQKFVEAYDANDARTEMDLSRDGLVALAMLLGGDYTEGVKGVGIVNGMEIVHAFDASADAKEGLLRFRKWLDGFDPFDSVKESDNKGEEEMTKERFFHRKHNSARARWVAPKSFPSPQVLNAYLNPVVETSEERFSWGVPDMDRLILFLNKHVGWSAEETQKLVQPVLDKLSRGSMHQTRIESFMRFEDSIRFADVRSKRLREVLNKAKTESGDQTLKKVKKSKTSTDASGPSKIKHFD